MSWDQLLDPDTFALMIPIVVILVVGIVAIVAMWIKHRERMGLIEQGIHPDHPPDEVDVEKDPAGKY